MVFGEKRIKMGLRRSLGGEADFSATLLTNA
jgi:hypothetical protein